jgi:plastin-1
MLQQADAIGCRKYVTPKDVCRGNSKLNLAFVANLFNTWPCLEPLTEEEKAALDDWLFNSQGSREARTFCLWINSLGVEPFVTDLFTGLQDGLIILTIMDMIEPGIVDWKKVNKGSKLNVFKKSENCNYAVVLGKSLKFSLVGVGGKDIVDGNQTLTLSLVWQLMRLHILTILKTLSDDGKRPTDDQVMAWANNTIAAKGKSSKISSFKDGSLRTSQFFLDLLDAIKGCIDYSLCDLTASCDDEAARLNARYAISVARSLGAVIFILPDDIAVAQGENPNPKLVFTFVASIMAAAKALNK